MNPKPLKLRLSSKNYLRFLERYANDPVRFAVEMCGLKKPTAWQVRFLEACRDKKKIARASGHGTGKTYICGIAALWFLLCFPEAHIYVTSATFDQLKTRYWVTQVKVVEESRVSRWVTVSAEEIRCKLIPGNVIRMQAWSISREQSWAGEHFKSPIAIFDESSDIAPQIFEAWAGSEGHEYSRTILIGNPHRKQGQLYDAFHSLKRFYDTEHLSCLDSEHVSREWIEEMKEKYGEDSDIYRVRVLGKFPNQDASGFLSQSLVEAAIGRKVDAPALPGLCAGLDVGRGGDPSVLFVRSHNRAEHILEFAESDSVLLADAVYLRCEELGVDMLAMDANGVGAGVYDILKRRMPGRVLDVMPSERAVDAKMYGNRRAELAGRLKEWLRYGSVDNAQGGQKWAQEAKLVHQIFGKDGRIMVEPKELIKKRLGHSCDFFDASCYSMAVDMTPRQRERDGHNSDKKARPRSAWVNR